MLMANVAAHRKRVPHNVAGRVDKDGDPVSKSPQSRKNQHHDGYNCQPERSDQRPLGSGVQWSRVPAGSVFFTILSDSSCISLLVSQGGVAAPAEEARISGLDREDVAICDINGEKAYLCSSVWTWRQQLSSSGSNMVTSLPLTTGT
jgi:hypothetical protein